MSEKIYLVVWSGGVSGPADLHSAEVFRTQAAAEARARALWGAPGEGEQIQEERAEPASTASAGVQVVLEEVWVAGGDDPEVSDFPGRRERRGQAPRSPVLAISDPEAEDEGAQLEVWEFSLRD